MDKLKLEYEIKRQGMTVQALCSRVGISRCAFYRKCNGKSEFTRSEIERIVAVLGLATPMGIFFAE